MVYNLDFLFVDGEVLFCKGNGTVEYFCSDRRVEIFYVKLNECR